MEDQPKLTPAIEKLISLVNRRAVAVEELEGTIEELRNDVRTLSPELKRNYHLLYQRLLNRKNYMLIKSGKKTFEKKTSRPRSNSLSDEQIDNIFEQYRKAKESQDVTPDLRKLYRRAYKQKFSREQRKRLAEKK